MCIAIIAGIITVFSSLVCWSACILAKAEDEMLREFDEARR